MMSEYLILFDKTPLQGLFLIAIMKTTFEYSKI